MTDKMAYCDECGEAAPKYKLSLADLDGIVIDFLTVCDDCALGVTVEQYLDHKGASHVRFSA